MRDEGGEPVVVAEAQFDGRDGVVLVDHRDRPERTQPVEGALRVAMLNAPADVVGGEQHLAHGAVVAGEGGAPGVSEGELPDAGRSLLRREITRPTRETERCEPGTDRTRGDHDDTRTRADPGLDGIDETIEPATVEPTHQARDRRRADLDHYAAGVGDDLPGVAHVLLGTLRAS